MATLFSDPDTNKLSINVLVDFTAVDQLSLFSILPDLSSTIIISAPTVIESAESSNLISASPFALSVHVDSFVAYAFAISSLPSFGTVPSISNLGSTTFT